MQRPSNNKLPIRISILLGAMFVILVAALTPVMLNARAKRKAEMQMASQAMRDMGSQLKKLSDVGFKGDLGDAPQFPDSALGKVQRRNYEFVAYALKQRTKLEEAMKTSNWEWVLSPPSIKGIANLEKAIAITKEIASVADLVQVEAKEEMQRLFDDCNKIVEQSNDSAARDFVKGMESKLNEPGSGFAQIEKTRQLQKDNYKSILAYLKFLLKFNGRYTVDSTGGITFDASVKQREVDAFNLIAIETQTTFAALQRFQYESSQKAQRGIETLNNVPK